LGVLAILVIASSHSFNNCVHEHKNDKAYEKLKQRVPFVEEPILGIARLAVRLRLGFSCAADEKNSGTLVAIFTALLALYTLALWRTTAQLADFARIQQRAYINIEPAGVENLYDPEAIAQVKIINSGGLPATAIRWTIDTDLDRDKRRSLFDYEVNIIDSTNLLAPKAGMPRFFNKALDRTIIDLFNQNKAALYVWGKVYYLDGFGRPRWTKFCHRYERDCVDPEHPRNLRAGRARQHQYGNGTDEDEGQTAT
jgi:hypothetical protein